MLLYIFFGIYCYLLCFLLLNILYCSTALFVWPPSIPSSRKSRRSIANLVKDYTGSESDLSIVDLGCGFGSLLFHVAKLFPRSRLIGYEVLKLPYFLCKLRVFFGGHSNIALLNEDFFATNFADFDVILCFLHRYTNEKLSSKLASEVKRGCIIISSHYEIPGWLPVKIITIRDIFFKKYIYLYKK